MTKIVDVAIVGAGPYGLSLAAHLAAAGVEFRAFGSPMHTWRTSMPEGMVLKSEGNASNLWDPAGELTLGRYAADNGLQYRDTGYPIPLTTFVGYGEAFQRRFVPGLEERQVSHIVPTRYGFDLHLEDGGVAPARRVIVAAGIRAYEYLPPELARLPNALASHSAQHVKVDGFRGREVAIIGGGASAINLAALLHQNDASVTLIVRKDRIDYCGAPDGERSLLDRMREPENGLGTGWRSWACCAMPDVFHALPEAFRLLIVKKHLPAAPGWTLQPQVDGIVPTLLGTTIAGAEDVGGRVRLSLEQAGGKRLSLTTDHVIGGTGYRVDMRRLSFLGPSVLDRLDCVEHTPRLSRHFESSIPGLYFVGTAAANSFGPMLRFAYGAGFTSRRLTGHLKRVLARHNRQDAAPAGWSKEGLAGT
ncbi:MAG: NAD(P)-binding domain-containing protein [Acetobacteraceae bacterium]